MFLVNKYLTNVSISYLLNIEHIVGMFARHIHIYYYYNSYLELLYNKSFTGTAISFVRTKLTENNDRPPYKCNIFVEKYILHFPLLFIIHY